MIVNQIGYDKQFGILKRLTFNKFSYYQDTKSQKIWESLNGGKDDVIIYKTNGDIEEHIKAGSNTKDRSHMGKGDEKCADAGNIKVVKTLLELLKEKNGMSEMKKCNDENDKDFEEIMKRKNAMPKRKKMGKEMKEKREEERKKKIEERKQKAMERKEKREEARKQKAMERKEKREEARKQKIEKRKMEKAEERKKKQEERKMKRQEERKKMNERRKEINTITTTTTTMDP